MNATTDLGFLLGDGETAHPLPDDAGLVVVVKVSALPPSDDPNIACAVQVDADIVDRHSGEIRVDLPPHPATMDVAVAGVPEDFAAAVAVLRTRAVERAVLRFRAGRAIAALPRTPEPGKSARRLARQAPPL